MGFDIQEGWSRSIGSGAATPGDQKETQVTTAHQAVAIEVGVSIIGSPGGEHESQVSTSNLSVTVQVAFAIGRLVGTGVRPAIAVGVGAEIGEAVVSGRFLQRLCNTG